MGLFWDHPRPTRSAVDELNRFGRGLLRPRFGPVVRARSNVSGLRVLAPRGAVAIYDWAAEEAGVFTDP